MDGPRPRPVWGVKISQLGKGLKCIFESIGDIQVMFDGRNGCIERSVWGSDRGTGGSQDSEEGPVIPGGI